MAKIFVPKTCRVGFQERADTFTKKLAYVIYYDAKGKLRKETSWETWRHKPDDTINEYDRETHEHTTRPPNVDVTPYDFENAPTSGFVLNKGHTRYSWSHFGSRRTVIRIYDPRGVEFEITPENLVGLLMHTDCSHREIQGELVYAWCGTELMLLPCSSEEYQSAMNYSKLQGKKVSAKDLKEGFTYITKNEEHLVYLGRHMWYETKSPYRDNNKRVGKKHHIFCDVDGKTHKPIKNVSTTIAKQVSDGCHEQFANWVDAYLKSTESSRIVGWERRPIPGKEWERDWDTARYPDDRLSAVTEQNGKMITVTIHRHRYPSRSGWIQSPAIDNKPQLSFVTHNVVHDDGSSEYIPNRGSSRLHGGPADPIVTDKTKFFFLYAVYANGIKRKWSD